MSKIKDTKFDRHTEIDTAYIVDRLIKGENKKYKKETMSLIVNALQYSFTESGVPIQTIDSVDLKKFKEEHPKMKFEYPEYYYAYFAPENFDMAANFSYYYIYKYTDTCIVKQENGYFDFFFALYFSMIDKSHTKEFLKYHLRYNFESSLSKFITFLHKTSYDNSKFLNKNWLLDIDALDNLDENLNEILGLNDGKMKKYTPNSFEEIFVAKDWKKYIDVLNKIDNPIINSNYEFIGKSQKHKGVICSWIKDLQTKGIIDKKYNRKQLAAVLNKGIKNLNLGKDGKTFDNYSKEYINKYKDHLLKLVN